jgi:hypothetical protein
VWSCRLARCITASRHCPRCRNFNDLSIFCVPARRLAAGLVAVASARTEMFGEWARKHGKQYASKEELVMRR